MLLKGIEPYRETARFLSYVPIVVDMTAKSDAELDRIIETSKAALNSGMCSYDVEGYNVELVCAARREQRRRRSSHAEGYERDEMS